MEFEVTDPQTGQTLVLQGDSPPTEAELEEIFSSVNAEPKSNGIADQLVSKASELGLPIEPLKPFLDNYFAAPEVVATLVSGAVKEPVAGGAAILSAINDEDAGEAVEEVRSTGNLPQGKAATTILQTAGKVVEPVIKANKAVADFAFDLTNSPAIAAAVESTPTLIMELLGVKGLNSLKRGTRLLENGRPTKKLRLELDKHGLDYDSLTPEAKAQIPDVVNNKFYDGKNPTAKTSAENALKEQIKSGAKDDSLAGLKIEGDHIVPDKLGLDAIKQGIDPGDVQAIKTANTSTKKSMLDMTKIMRRIKKNKRLSLDMRPTDVVGNAVMKRVAYIKQKSLAARNELNQIAKTRLPGKDMDTVPVVNKLTEVLDDLDIKLGDKNGVPVPDFKGSVISKDRASQKAIKDVIDLMAEGGKPDALRFHKLKRQLDNLIDFRKKDVKGLSKEGRDVLKKMRAQLNDSLRTVDPDYARVNDVMNESLTALDSLDLATGTIDIFGKGSNKAIGTNLRGLLSNRQGRVKLENALNTLDETAKNLSRKTGKQIELASKVTPGSKTVLFDDDLKTLVMYADTLDSRFGTVAKTSFSGQISEAVEQSVRRGAKESVMDMAAKKAGETAGKLRGINDFNAFESLEVLLGR